MAVNSQIISRVSYISQYIHTHIHTYYPNVQNIIAKFLSNLPILSYEYYKPYIYINIYKYIHVYIIFHRAAGEQNVKFHNYV